MNELHRRPTRSPARSESPTTRGRRALARSLALATVATALGAFSACGGDVVPLGGGAPADHDGGSGGTDTTPLVPATKVDLLFVVDNSSGMASKQAILARSVAPFLDRFVRPSCVDANGNVVGPAKDGACSAGSLEHAPLDLHVGVISSALGAVTDPNGLSVCDAANPRADDRARLQNHDANGDVVARATRGFLESAGPIDDAARATLLADTAALIAGVGETGCGFEAQLESMYRFLAQPDPYGTLTVGLDGRAVVSGVDATLLAQRRAFLRPDSALVIVMLTDEDDSNVDARALGGQGWAFASRSFPGSKVYRGGSFTQGATAPRGSSPCADDPAAKDATGGDLCTSCGFAYACPGDTPACQRLKEDPACTAIPAGFEGQDGVAGYYAPGDDSLNVRFHHMKQRFGVDPQFPLARYVRALTQTKVPNRDTEHTVVDGSGATEYAHAPTCTNPIFAAALPDPDGELCDLPVGPRSNRLVFFGLIGGVTQSLVPDYRGGASPNWTALVGANPDAYDESGIDPHMIASATPRPGLASPTTTRGDNGDDPAHGREWDTGKQALQFACTFDLETTRECTAQDPSCVCAFEGENPPLCGSTLGAQTRAGATPSLRPLRVAKALADQAVITSICPATTDATSADYGYRVGLDALAARVGKVLAK